MRQKDECSTNQIAAISAERDIEIDGLEAKVEGIENENEGLGTVKRDSSIQRNGIGEGRDGEGGGGTETKG